MSLSRSSFASHRNYSMTHPGFLLAKIQLHLIETILRQFQIVSLQKCNSYHRKCSKTIPKCLFAEIHVHLIEFLLRQFQTVS